MEREFTKREAAELLGAISIRTLEHRMKARLIGFYRDGRRVSFGAHHIEQYRLSKEQRPAARFADRRGDPPRPISGLAERCPKRHRQIVIVANEEEPKGRQLPKTQEGQRPGARSREAFEKELADEGLLPERGR